MVSQIVALDKNKHQKLRIKQDTTFAIAKNQHLVLLQAYEFINACSYFPIVFIKDVENGEFRSVAMLGLEPNENLIYEPSGWSAYIPAILRNPPFALVPKQGDTEQFTMCINLNSDLVSETDGEKLFDEAGAESDYLRKIKDSMSVFVSQAPVTTAFVNYLTEKKLLTPMSLSINIEGDEKGKYSLNGIYVIDNKNFSELSDKEFLDLRKKAYLPAIYAQLSSMNLISKLAHIKAKQNK